ncbi:MAG: G-rich domain on putative tyrosine kinase [Nevskia sp.]|nr:G-rich domain on putative tyrosine kinase [Nevskia sp.]
MEHPKIELMNDKIESNVSGGTPQTPSGYLAPHSGRAADVRTDDELSLVDLVRYLLNYKQLIFATTLLCGLVAAIVSLLMTPVYRAEVLLSPVEQEGPKANLGGLMNQLGAFASLAGIGSGGSDKDESIATLQSRSLTDTFVQEKNLLPILFARKWDTQKQSWKSQDPKEIPTLWDANKLFLKTIRKVVQDRKTGLVTLTIDWKDPKLAADWANDMVRRTNLYLRSKAIARSTTNINYLQDQLTKTSVVEIHQAVNSLIEQEIKKVMLAQGTEEYAFKIVDPAVVPEERTSPKRTLITLGGLVLGFLIGAMIAIGRSSRKIEPA